MFRPVLDHFCGQSEYIGLYPHGKGHSRRFASFKILFIRPHAMMPPLTATAMNSAPDWMAGLASGVNNAVARVAGLLWIAALPPITGLVGAAYTHPARFQASFAQISWICAAAFACAAALAATFITGPRRATPPARPALVQTPVPHLACPVAFRHVPGTDPRAKQQ